MSTNLEPIMESENQIQSALAAGRALGGIQNLTADGVSVPVVVIPEGYTAKALDMEEAENWMQAPLRKKGGFDFADVDSFNRYFNEHKSGSSRIFAEIRDNSASFRGVLDFHDENPSFNEHICRVSMKPTLEWTIWTGANKKHMPQADFAQFLEDNADVFTDPRGADLLELIQTLEGKSHVNITQAVKLQNGGLRLNFVEDVELRGGVSGSQSGEMLIPTILNVSIAPFDGVGKYPLTARLRYRIAERKITFWYETINMHLVVRAVASDMLDIIEKQTGVQPFKT